MNTLRRAALTLALLAAGPAAWAQGDALTGRSPWALLAQALLSLAVVVGVIYLVYFGLRRFSARQLDAGADGPMRLVQARHLGGDRWLYLVEVEGRRIVIGGTDAQITPITELQPPGGARADDA